MDMKTTAATTMRLFGTWPYITIVSLNYSEIYSNRQCGCKYNSKLHTPWFKQNKVENHIYVNFNLLDVTGMGVVKMFRCKHIYHTFTFKCYGKYFTCIIVATVRERHKPDNSLSLYIRIFIAKICLNLFGLLGHQCGIS